MVSVNQNPCSFISVWVDGLGIIALDDPSIFSGNQVTGNRSRLVPVYADREIASAISPKTVHGIILSRPARGRKAGASRESRWSGAASLEEGTVSGSRDPRVEALRVTPAVEAGIATRVWEIRGL